GRIRRDRPRSIRLHDVDGPPARAEPVREDVASHGRPRQQDSTRRGVDWCRELVEQRFRDEARRYEVSRDVPSLENLGGPRTDRGNAHSAEVTGVAQTLEQPGRA